MLNNKVENIYLNQVMIHDINSSLSALQGALELIKDEWRTNPILVDKILPLTLDKVNLLKLQLSSYHNGQI